MNNVSLGDEVKRIAAVYKYIVECHGTNFTKMSNSYQAYVDFVKKDDYSDEEGLLIKYSVQKLLLFLNNAYGEKV